MARKDNQITGNIGLYLVCYELSKRGWNVLPTSRNAKGVDIVAYSQDATRTITIQVKALYKKSPVPFGNSLEHKLIADFIIICNELNSQHPNVFIAIPNDIQKKIHIGKKGDNVSYWLQPKDYQEFENNWNLIGDGF